MLNTIFAGIFDSSMTKVISVQNFLLCLVCSLVIGLMIAVSYTFRTRYTRSFVATLAIMPAAVCVVIMMVNGNIGTGVAIAGAFGLVRFRSAQGTAKEIGAIFIAMGAGLITGMGYLGYGFLFALLLSCITMLYSCLDFGFSKNEALYRTLHITIPEDLDYTGVFEELFPSYASGWELTQVKTSNMGALFRLTYDITLKSAGLEKKLIDQLRTRNGNLEISMSRRENTIGEL